MLNRSRALRGLAPVVLVLAAACSDRNPVGAGPVVEPTPDAVALIKCDVTVASGTMSCAQQSFSGLTGARALITGGQGAYVKLTSSGTSWDAGTEVLQSNVTVQNLLRVTMGTPDGITVDGVRVFFSSGPVVTAGTGVVEVINEDGVGTFTGGSQEFFLYNQMLETYEISAARTWQFSVPSTVGTFSFTVMVSAQLTDEAARAGLIWTGAADSLWSNGANWKGGVAPTPTSSVSILADSAVAGRFPVLGSDEQIANVYVSAGSTVDLAGFTLEASGNVDAPGAIAGGTVRMTGAGTVLRGNVPALVLTGSSTLQGGTQATAAVSLQDGVLNIQDQALSISIP